MIIQTYGIVIGCGKATQCYSNKVGAGSQNSSIVTDLMDYMKYNGDLVSDLCLALMGIKVLKFSFVL